MNIKDYSSHEYACIFLIKVYEIFNNEMIFAPGERNYRTELQWKRNETLHMIGHFKARFLKSTN